MYVVEEGAGEDEREVDVVKRAVEENDWVDVVEEGVEENEREMDMEESVEAMTLEKGVVVEDVG